MTKFNVCFKNNGFAQMSTKIHKMVHNVKLRTVQKCTFFVVIHIYVNTYICVCII